MHAAALSGSTEVVSLLLEAGADPTLRNAAAWKSVVIVFAMGLVIMSHYLGLVSHDEQQIPCGLCTG